MKLRALPYTLLTALLATTLLLAFPACDSSDPADGFPGDPRLIGVWGEASGNVSGLVNFSLSYDSGTDRTIVNIYSWRFIVLPDGSGSFCSYVSHVDENAFVNLEEFRVRGYAYRYSFSGNDLLALSQGNNNATLERPTVDSFVPVCDD